MYLVLTSRENVVFVSFGVPFIGDGHGGGDGRGETAPRCPDVDGWAQIRCWKGRVMKSVRWIPVSVVPDSTADAVWTHKYLQDGPLLDLCLIKWF